MFNENIVLPNKRFKFMFNENIVLPKEIWNEIMDYCPDHSTFACLSLVNKEISNIARDKLKIIQQDSEHLFIMFDKLQDYYTIKYQNINGPHTNINTIGKYVCMNFGFFKDGSIFIFPFTPCEKPEKIQKNQIVVEPVFGEEEIGKFTRENNPNYPFLGIGLDSQAYSIAQDRLPIKKICATTGNSSLCIALDIALNKANKHYYKINGSFMDAFFNISSNQ